MFDLKKITLQEILRQKCTKKSHYSVLEIKGKKKKS